ncbi:MAG TPA: hypothetical protein PKA90_14995 [Ignavibacteria bacterium]|nr:hypothetical protein [Ignavibacteria bacterium]HMR41724.1 hypothetical protein [Ignavibacteria bacterium]
MEDLVKKICEETRISEEHSKIAVNLVFDFLKGNLPPECKKELNKLSRRYWSSGKFALQKFEK